jgi:hypothetical protein
VAIREVEMAKRTPTARRRKTTKTFGALTYSVIRKTAEHFVSEVYPKIIADAAAARSAKGQRADSCSGAW